MRRARQRTILSVRAACVVCLFAGGMMPTSGQAQILSHWLTGPREAQRLANADPQQRLEAARALGRWGEGRRAVEVLTEALRNERDSAVQREIVRSLARRGLPSAVPALVEALRSRRDIDRASVTQALGSIGTAPAIRALVEALPRSDVGTPPGDWRSRDDPPSLDAPSSGPALGALVRVGIAAVPVLIRALREAPAPILIIRALGAIADPRAVRVLVRHLDHERPAVRVAALDALSATCVDTAADRIAERLADPSAEVVTQALIAIRHCGRRQHVGPVLALVADAPVAHRRAALRALWRIAPATAAPLLSEAVAAGDSEVAQTAVDIVLADPHPAAVPLLFGLVREGTRADDAADALAAVEGGAGLWVLAEVADHEGELASTASRALAVGIRRWGERVPSSLRRRALRVLQGPASGTDTHRRLILRAVARDPWVEPWLVEALRSTDPRRRAIGAQGLGLLGSVDDPTPLLTALAHESEAAPFRRMADAALVLGARPPLARLWHRMDDPRTAPEAMAIAATVATFSSMWDQRRLGRAVRRALRADAPRVRAGAAWALGAWGAPEAWRALVATLEDPSTDVRRAAAAALEALAVADAVPAMAARRRMETDVRVAAALADAIEAPSRRRLNPAGRKGGDVLRFRIVTATEEGRSGIPVDVVLPDGRWIRLETLGNGELFVGDQPAGVADVRVRMDP